MYTCDTLYIRIEIFFYSIIIRISTKNKFQEVNKQKYEYFKTYSALI